MEPAPPEDDDEDADVDTRRTRTHCIAELRGGALSAASDGGDWGGVSADVTARAAAVAVSTRRLQLLSELQGLLDGGGGGGGGDGGSGCASGGGGGGRGISMSPRYSTLCRHEEASSGKQPPSAAEAAEAAAAATPVSLSVHVGTVGLLVLNDEVPPRGGAGGGGGRGGDSENFGVPLLEGAILGLSASLTTDVHRAPGPSVTGSIGRRVHRAPGPPTSIGRRVTFNVEAQTLLDFLNHHKGAWQGLTLVHFSSQHKRFLWDRGCI